MRVGESGLAFYRASNPTEQRLAGTSTFNVTPLKAGQYFNKVQCFCFTEQTLAAGQSMDMAVSFFVDPAIEEDPNLDDVKTITLSYTFFPDLDPNMFTMAPPTIPSCRGRSRHSTKASIRLRTRPAHPSGAFFWPTVHCHPDRGLVRPERRDL